MHVGGVGARTHRVPSLFGDEGVCQPGGALSSTHNSTPSIMLECRSCFRPPQQTEAPEVSVRERRRASPSLKLSTSCGGLIALSAGQQDRQIDVRSRVLRMLMPHSRHNAVSTNGRTGSDASILKLLPGALKQALESSTRCRFETRWGRCTP